MNDMIETTQNLPAQLDGYVQQGQMFLFNAAQNLVQFGRVLVEAKPLVPHGEFEGWVETNFKVSIRKAQTYMQAWRRYGQKERFQAVQFSNLQKMLALPEGMEEEFADTNDLEHMTAREVEKAVQEFKKGSDAQLQKERAARKEAERRAQQAEAQAGQIPPSVKASLDEKNETLDQYEAEVRRLRREVEQANREKNDALANLNEVEELMEENQREYNRMQGELLNAQSTIARGDAERLVLDQLTAEDFSAAVRGFLGSVSQMPYMKTTFSQITNMQEIRQWDELLQAVEGWTVQARKALNTVDTGGEVIG